MMIGVSVSSIYQIVRHNVEKVHRGADPRNCLISKCYHVSWNAGDSCRDELFGAERVSDIFEKLRISIDLPCLLRVRDFLIIFTVAPMLS